MSHVETYQDYTQGISIIYPVEIHETGVLVLNVVWIFGTIKVVSDGVVTPGLLSGPLLPCIQKATKGVNLKQWALACIFEVWHALVFLANMIMFGNIFWFGPFSVVWSYLPEKIQNKKGGIDIFRCFMTLYIETYDILCKAATNVLNMYDFEFF